MMTRIKVSDFANMKRFANTFANIAKKEELKGFSRVGIKQGEKRVYHDCFPPYEWWR